MLKSLFQKVLVAYNGSKSSLNAVLYGIMMAKVYKCSLKIVYVVDTASIKQLTISKFMVADEAEKISCNLEEDGKKNLDYCTGLAKQKGIKVETEVLHGVVWSEIIRAADSWKSDLILLGGLSDNNDLYSSHANLSKQESEIIGSAHCSVMVVRDQYMEHRFRMV